MKLGTIITIGFIVIIIFIIMFMAGWINQKEVVDDARKAGGLCIKWDENTTKCLGDLFSRQGDDYGNG